MLELPEAMALTILACIDVLLFWIALILLRILDALKGKP